MALRIMVVDDEPLARGRLRNLMGDLPPGTAEITAEAGNAVQAMTMVRAQPVDAVLLDVHMPGADGLQLARALRELPQPPALVFVTAHAEHAVGAFELEAADYLTKPVRLERLQQALQKAERQVQTGRRLPGYSSQESLIIHDRGRTERVPLAEVLYLKAELKYITVRTASRSYILDGSLSDLEQRHGARFLRIHRNALVSRGAVRALERHDDPREGEAWVIRLNGLDETLSVSRRRLGAVREALNELG